MSNLLMENKENLITINPKVKEKGFKNNNLKIEEPPNAFNVVQKRIKGLLNTKYYAVIDLQNSKRTSIYNLFFRLFL